MTPRSHPTVLHPDDQDGDAAHEGEHGNESQKNRGHQTSQNVPACASCHGTEAKGDGQFPRLAGQLYDYVTRNLTNWESERGQGKANLDTSAIMQAIARDLSEAQIKAVAAYVSQLE